VLRWLILALALLLAGRLAIYAIRCAWNPFTSSTGRRRAPFWLRGRCAASKPRTTMTDGHSSRCSDWVSAVASSARNASPPRERRRHPCCGVLRRRPARDSPGLLRRHPAPAPSSRHHEAPTTATPTEGLGPPLQLSELHHFGAISRDGVACPIMRLFRHQLEPQSYLTPVHPWRLNRPAIGGITT
jgi:hypothetical protein